MLKTKFVYRQLSRYTYTRWIPFTLQNLNVESFSNNEDVIGCFIRRSEDIFTVQFSIFLFQRLHSTTSWLFIQIHVHDSLHWRHLNIYTYRVALNIKMPMINDMHIIVLQLERIKCGPLPVFEIVCEFLVINKPVPRIKFSYIIWKCFTNDLKQLCNPREAFFFFELEVTIFDIKTMIR